MAFHRPSFVTSFERAPPISDPDFPPNNGIYLRSCVARVRSAEQPSDRWSINSLVLLLFLLLSQIMRR